MPRGDPILGTLVLGNKVCGIERQTYWFFGPVIEPGCKQNVVFGTSASLVSSMCASCCLAIVSPMLGMGASVVVFAICTVLCCLGVSEANRSESDSVKKTSKSKKPGIAHRSELAR
jgi:hypothetical protein